VRHDRLRTLLVSLWAIVLAGALYLFFFQREVLQRELADVSSTSMIAGSLLYLFFGSIRGFTLIPSTTLVFAALPFFPPVPLFLLTLVGILVSSASIYFFSEALHLDELIGAKHQDKVAALRTALQKYQMPVIIGWSFFPLAPTDLICYVCGVLEVDFRKCLLGVAIGEGLICALYIFLGDYALQRLHLR
jgi:uncharacterized membrane protein YdjX (TVP38/TMEM64 family)